MKEANRAAQTKSYMWAQASGTGPPIRLFSYAPSRTAKTALALYAGARGALVSDGYEVYAAVARAGNLTHLGCWVHARRMFVEAEADIPKAQRKDSLAARFIALIGALYAIEARWNSLDEATRTPTERLRLRQAESRPMLHQIEALLQQHLHSTLPASLIGKALHYLAGQWPKLIRYVEDARYPIDNNLRECHQAVCGQAPFMALLRHAIWCTRQRQSLLPHRDSQG